MKAILGALCAVLATVLISTTALGGADSKAPSENAGAESGDPQTHGAGVTQQLRKAIRTARAAKRKANRAIAEAAAAQGGADEALAEADQARSRADEALAGADAARATAEEALARRAVYYAKVDADTTGATLLSGDATAVGRVAQGVFSVTFPVEVGGCGWTATRQDNADGVATPGEITVERESISAPNVLWVRTFNSAGGAADPSESDGFTLMLIC